MAQQPHEIVWTLTNNVIASRCLHVVAVLGGRPYPGRDGERQPAVI